MIGARNDSSDAAADPTIAGGPIIGIATTNGLAISETTEVIADDATTKILDATDAKIIADSDAADFAMDIAVRRRTTGVEMIRVDAGPHKRPRTFTTWRRNIDRPPTRDLK